MAETNEKKEKIEEKRTEAKRDQQQIEIAGIKNGFRAVRKILLMLLPIPTAMILLFWFSSWNLTRALRFWTWVAFIVCVVGLYLTKALKLVTEGERGVVLRFKQYHRTFLPGPNLMWLWPFEKVIFVDIREREINIPPQKVITKDNVVVTVDAVMNFKIQTGKSERIGFFKSLWKSVKRAEEKEKEGAAKSLFKVTNPEAMLIRLTTAAIRDQIGVMNFEAEKGTGEVKGVIDSKEEISSKAKEILSGYAEAWGIEITRVKIEEIEPPKELMEAMNKRMIAKQLKAATITESEGEAQRRRNVADGEAEAIQKISKAQAERFAEFQKVDPRLGALALDTVGKITPNKIILIGKDLGDAARNLGNFWYPKKPENSHTSS